MVSWSANKLTRLSVSKQKCNMRGWVTLRLGGESQWQWWRNCDDGPQHKPHKGSSLLFSTRQNSFAFLLLAEWRVALQQIENWTFPRVTPCFPRMVGWRRALILRSGAFSTAAEPLLAWAAQMPTSTFWQQPVGLHKPACGHLLHLSFGSSYFTYFWKRNSWSLWDAVKFWWFDLQCPQASLQADWLKYLQHEVSLHFSLTFGLQVLWLINWRYNMTLKRTPGVVSTLWNVALVAWIGFTFNMGHGLM